jgi:hypothetical protein
MINRMKDLLNEAVLPTVDVPSGFCAHLDFLWRPCPVLRIHRHTQIRVGHGASLGGARDDRGTVVATIIEQVRISQKVNKQG